MAPGTGRTPLSSSRVLVAAVELADEAGVDAVSMRALAQRLGVVPMALYKHVASKEVLLDGMVDQVLIEIEDPDPALDWRAAVRARVLGARRAVLRHPWARRAIESRTRRTPVVLGHMDAVARLLLAGGFSPDLTHHVMHALGNRIWGFSPELFEEEPAQGAALPDPEQQAEMAREFAQRFPGILAVATAATGGDLSAVGQGCDEDFEFEFALDLLLDGAERLHRAGWTSPARSTVHP
ncbi:TetR/AcrR family transcriptional regulator [Blastococcus sp. TBT05-19]|uniref:TetR/AcrR family transcriptional regulator n=1 Tax=Blastococcus sp. TBT05-19 TaxID=2250581 RepID=UPI000DE9875F|nr:TetR/AcrR family transcriptional regulator C-terminal domain-containing protein [Blastococcus sp. TBT05-19]RBY94477.1 TetR/AcrR family transcriptional regulator [Blastococcus sp. TBT05-19]